MRKVGMLMAPAAALVGCSTSESGYRRLQDALRNPDVARDVISECIKAVGRQPRKTREQAANAIKVSLSAMPSIYCRRVFDGLASGRLTGADWDSLGRGEPTDDVVRVVKGG